MFKKIEKLIAFYEEEERKGEYCNPYEIEEQVLGELQQCIVEKSYEYDVDEYERLEDRMYDVCRKFFEY